MTALIQGYGAKHTRHRDRGGRTYAGHFVDTAQGATRAVVVIHDFFGLTPHVRSVTSRLASEGFLAFAPDLYRGQVAADRDEAQALAKRLAWNQVAVELGLVVCALKERRPDMKVAAVGFAMGGAAAMVAAAAVPKLDAAVTFYGIPQDVTVENPKLRVQGHFAVHDDKCTQERVLAFAGALAEHGVSSELHRYDASNGFFNGSRPDVYSEAHATTAWARTLLFLRAALA